MLCILIIKLYLESTDFNKKYNSNSGGIYNNLNTINNEDNPNAYNLNNSKYDKMIEEVLYPAMESRKLNIVIIYFK